MNSQPAIQSFMGTRSAWIKWTQDVRTKRSFTFQMLLLRLQVPHPSRPWKHLATLLGSRTTSSLFDLKICVLVFLFHCLYWGLDSSISSNNWLPRFPADGSSNLLVVQQVQLLRLSQVINQVRSYTMLVGTIWQCYMPSTTSRDMLRTFMSPLMSTVKTS